MDLTGIDAIGVETVQVVLSEYGPDLSRYPTEKQFVITARTVRRKSGKRERLSTPGTLRLLMQQSIHPTAEAGKNLRNQPENNLAWPPMF